MSALRNFTFTTFCVLLVVKGLSTAPVNVPLTSVSNLLIQTALNSLNESSPNHHTYQNGELISAQKLEVSPFTVYRLTFNLDPACDDKSVCPKEACTLEVKQHERGAVSVNRDSVQCLYLHPQSKPQVPNPDHEQIDSLEKPIGDNIKLDHEVQTSADHNDRPFIAVPANKSPYCPGCPYELNPRNLPGVSAFVDQIVKSMDDSLPGDFKHTAITILRISRSVPPNANVVRYEFLILIAETSCLKTSLVERTECSLQSGVPINRCLVTLEEKPWQENSRVITKNNCTGTNLENELHSSVGTSFSPANMPSENNSASSVLNQEGYEDSKTEFFDQVAQEGKFSTYETMPNQYFEPPTLNLTVEGDDGNIKRVVVDEPAKKVLLDKDHVEAEKKEEFADRMKEFDSFLKEFDVLVREMEPKKDERIPVVEDVIKQVKIERGSQSEEENGEGSSKKLIESIRVKRDLANEDLVLVQDELLLKKLARKAIAILDDIDSDSMKRIVLKVLEAKKEKVKTNQVNYYLKLKVATTTCSEGELDFAEERRCLEDAINPVRSCKIQILTSEENPLLSPKIIESACIDFSEEVKTRRRREILAGGSTKKDIKDPKIQKYAQLGLQEYAKNFDSSYEPIIANITDAKVQVVSGILYKIKVQFGNSNCRRGETENCQLQSDGERKECLIKAWSQPWLDNDNPKITVDCESDEGKGSDSLNSKSLARNVEVERKRRSLPGGITPMNISDPDIQNYAKLGLQQYSQSLQSVNEPVIARIVEASSQVVSGMLYRIKVQFGSSDCPKGQTENCQLQSDSELKECDIEAWSQPWLDKGKPKITVTCGSKRRKRSTYEAKAKEWDDMYDMPVSIDDTVETNAQQGLQKYAETSKSLYEPLIAKIINATDNSDLGVTKITVKIGDSNCKKGEKNNCKLQPHTKLKECLMRISDDQTGRRIEVVCNDSKQSKKKSHKVKSKRPNGGTAPGDVNDPEVKKYANYGLKKYSESLKGSQEPVIAKIITASGSKQVDGMLYKIEVQFGDSDCPKGKRVHCKLLSDPKLRQCVLEIVKAPGVNNEPSKVTVNCKPSDISPEGSQEKSDTVKSRPRRDTERIKRTTDEDKRYAEEDKQFEEAYDTQTPVNAQYKKYAKNGLKKYAETSKSLYEPIIATIVNATENPDSMVNKVYVKFGDSTCKRGQTQNCKLQPHTKLTDCVIRIAVSPNGDHTEVICNDSNKSARKSKKKSDDVKSNRVHGGNTPRNVNDPDNDAKEEQFWEEAFDVPTLIDENVKKNAQLGLKKYAETSKSPYEPLIVKIINATENNDSGINKINVKFGDSTCKKGQKQKCKLQTNTESTQCMIKYPWGNEDFKDYTKVTVVCNQSEKSKRKSAKVKSKRSHGGKTPRDVNDTDIKNYANFGLKKYSETLKSPQEPVIAKIITAAASKHSDGMHYKIEAQFGDSDCPKGKRDHCKLLTDPKLRQCMLDIVIAPGVNNVPSKVKVDCKTPKHSPEESEQKSGEIKSRPRRDALLGGTSPMDVNDPDIQNYAKLGLQQYSQTLQSANEPVIARIIEASSQVVSGMLYRIKVQFGNSNCPKGQTEYCQLQSDSELTDCEIKAWSRPWLDKGKPKITVTCGSERRKRSTALDKELASEQKSLEDMFDAPTPINDQYKKYAQEGLKKYAETSKSLYEPLIAKLLNATENDDAEVKKVYVKFGDSTCKKGEKNNCKLQPHTKLTDCVVRVYDDQDGHRVEVVCNHPKKSNKKSSKVKSKRPHRGSTTRDVNDPDIKNYANFGLKKYSETLKSPQEPVIAKIITAGVSKHSDGMHYKIEAQFGDSDCPKGKTDNCKLLSDPKVRQCMLDIVMASGVNNVPSKVTVDCKTQKNSPEKSEEKSDTVKSRPRRDTERIKRSTDLEFQEEFDEPFPIDDQVKKEVQLGLKKYAETSKSPYEPIIAKITHSTLNRNLMVQKATVKIGDSNCKRGEHHNCKLQADTKLKDCLIRIPYSGSDSENYRELTVDCNHLKKSPKESKKKSKDVNSKQETLPLDVNASYTKSTAELGLPEYSKKYQSPNEPIIAKVIKGSSTELEDNARYEIEVQIGDSDCVKGTRKNCKLQSGAKLRDCVITVLLVPWVGDPLKVIVDCKPLKKSPEESEEKSDKVKSRRRRDTLLDGRTAMDVNDSDIQNYANTGRTKRSLRGQNYSQKMLQQAEEMKEEQNTDQSEKDNLREESYTDKMLRQAEEIKEERMKDLVSEERSLRGQNYNQKMLKQAGEMKEEGNTDQSEKENLQGENYSPKMLRQAEEIKEERMNDLVSEERSLRGQNYNQKMLKQAGEIKDETLEAEQLFRNFVQEFRKVYPNDEEKQKRLGIFRENLKKIEELRRYEEGTGEYGVTNFADLTTEEFRSNYLGLRPELKSENEIPFPMAEIPDVSLPTEFDWRKKNAVTGVKDQGSCGSCWAFSVTGNIEGQYAIKHGELLSFSEQELVDCDKLDEGCNGGLPDSAYRAIEKLGGLETESDYPYDAEDDTCHFSKSKIKVKVLSAVNITSNETEMAQWLVQNGPISIGINANAMQFYIGGISHPPKFLCDPKNLDHGVLIVGFGVHTYPIFKKTLPFWIVKNSWGRRWGERGYYRVYRGGSTCGVNQMASSAIVA
ncbi:uncharacterized protein LOC117173989 [Belonocnema kinseyi]|uniref:uncharacterized protein LOC117173989 n=1 Tax=Belonocnema kinseyi TaxID=2817044 RepID=UPI00143DAD26|nr:uncharacterized protein LOC117173989 [Belonocnema kinseyi]